MYTSNKFAELEVCLKLLETFPLNLALKHEWKFDFEWNHNSADEITFMQKNECSQIRNCTESNSKRNHFSIVTKISRMIRNNKEIRNKKLKCLPEGRSFNTSALIDSRTPRLNRICLVIPSKSTWKNENELSYSIIKCYI